MARSADKRRDPRPDGAALITVDTTALDPGLTSLFASSLGPVEPPPKSRYHHVVNTPPHKAAGAAGDEEAASDSGVTSSSDDGSEEGADEAASPNASSNASSDEDGDDSEHAASDTEAVLAEVRETVLDGVQEGTNKKRKRGDREADVEDVYMQKIAREEAKDEEKRKKKLKRDTVRADGADEPVHDAEESDDRSYTIPKHETLMDAGHGEAEELEKAARTVFLGNVSNEAIVSKTAEKTLRQHLSSFIPDMADNKPPHKIESIRFRSTAFAGALPKRAAFAKKELMDATTKSTNAYAVYSTKLAAREAVKKLNGTIVLGRHLRVDSLAHPSKVDHRRCVFVGNLGFVDDESNLNAEEGDKKKKKSKPPSDVEEGLWVQFGKAGKVESVRVVRDPKTRVGKGFAYVQFEDENGVEAALQFNDQKFPPLLPRKLRVVRARPQKKKDKKPSPSVKPSPAQSKSGYNAKISEEQKSKQGRARAMLGKVAAYKSAESFVFEGHRATSKQGHSGLKLGGKKKKGPNGRKARSKAWKAAGGKR